MTSTTTADRGAACRSGQERLLGEVGAGPCTVQRIGVPLTARRRLAELGLRAGVAVQVLQRTAGGGIVVGIGGSRVAVDRSTAALIAVLPVAA